MYSLGIIVVSDSASVTGLPDGTYRFGSGIDVEVKNDAGICVILNTNTLAGRYILTSRHYSYLHVCLLVLQ